MFKSKGFTFLLLVLLSLCSLTRAENEEISGELEILIKARLADGAQKSWELGTRAQTLLELDVPLYSVFSNNSLPPPRDIPSNLEDNFDPIFKIATDPIQRLNIRNSPEPLMEDGSAADPASIGVSVLLANWTGQSGGNFSQAAQNQLDFLYLQVPRTGDGAISHRVSEAQLWSDFIYMVPPFLAYFGVTTSNASLISDSYNQIRLYRNYLRDPDQENLWRHIVVGSGTDEGHWTTGNGWVAMGMLRVLCTIKNSQFSNDFLDEQKNLVDWIREVLNGMYEHLDKGNIFANYPERYIEDGNFYDAAGTALIAASAYRFALVANEYRNLPLAEWIRRTLSSQESDGSWTHFDADGWLTPVVNPHSFSVEGSQSAEGQAFVLMMQQSWREWVAGGSVGANAAASRHITSTGAICVGFTSLMVIAFM